MGQRGTSRPNTISRIVKIRQMLLRWRNKATVSSRSVPPDVPSGHVAVSVGNSCRRFVVPATHLNHPVFRKLLVKAEEEYGFDTRGPLLLPCDEIMFEHILRVVMVRSDLADSERSCHFGESAPMIHKFAEKSVF